jgi:uncharacterized protein (DUF4415 family)
MPRKPVAGKTPLTAFDDAPELTAEFFARAELHDGARLIRRGRPRSEAPKQQVTLRLDPRTLGRLRARGRHWQTWVGEELKAALDREEHRRRT